MISRAAELMIDCRHCRSNSGTPESTELQLSILVTQNAQIMITF